LTAPEEACHACDPPVNTEAVTEYAYQRNSVVTNNGVQALNERLGFLAHELRDLVHTATLAVTAMRSGMSD
jgi:hypothetical protein